MVMASRSLRQTLARQWMAFATVMTSLLAGATLLLLFLLEDSFIDRRLRTMATTVIDPATTPANLPAVFRVMRWPDLPQDIHDAMAGKRIGAIAEFRRTDGRYVHVLSAKAAGGQPFVMLYDVTDELTVNHVLRDGFVYVSAFLLLSLLAANTLARLFVGRNSRHAHRLMQQVLASPDPQSMQSMAQHEPISEFRELLQLHADVWQAQQAAVKSERETLAFLAHELRTPLQSARTSLALLIDSPANTRALERLQRATERLTRASNAILWLSSQAEPPASRIQAAHCLAALMSEFEPLASLRGQSLQCDVPPELHWMANQDVVETMLANLLLNAIQHGCDGNILLDADAQCLRLRNPLQQNSVTGFGLGLNIVRRLAERLGWQFTFTLTATAACSELRWAAVAEPSP